MSALGYVNNTNPMVFNIGPKVTRIPAMLTYGRYDEGGYTGETKISSINFADNSECTTIADYAFINCNVLTINWGANSKLENIGEHAFHCGGSSSSYLSRLT